MAIKAIFTRRRLDAVALDELEELLIASDMGVGVAGEVKSKRCAGPALAGRGDAGGNPRRAGPRTGHPAGRPDDETRCVSTRPASRL